jgi:hypothetical protein
MSKKNDPKSQGRTGGLPPFQQKTNPKGSPTDSPIILISETKETKESKNENKNESEENQEEKISFLLGMLRMTGEKMIRRVMLRMIKMLNSILPSDC